MHLELLETPEFRPIIVPEGIFKTTWLMSKIGGLIFEQKAPNEEDPTKLNYSWRFRESVFEDVHHCAIYWEKMQLDMEHPRAPPFDCWHRS